MKSYFLSLLLLFTTILSAQKPTRNVIMMIPDGTSISVLSLARWYQWNADSTQPWLAVDPYICGLVKTHSSDAPIGDSAPTSSWYATGNPSQTGFVATFPPPDPGNDLVPLDTARAYQPMMTVLEAAKLGGKRTGLVVTCQFPHATPADFSAHYPKRGAMKILARQMAYNNIDIVFAGGYNYLGKEEKEYLGSHGWDTITHNLRRMLHPQKPKAWALFHPDYMPNDLDRNPLYTPSLAELTGQAIDMLSNKNEKGFFLMVEGSKIDWAAHDNDPVGIITEFLAFDKAVKTAIDFAKKDGHTTVIICPDHGNSGLSIGNERSNQGYDKLTKKQLFDKLSHCKLTAEGMAAKIMQFAVKDKKQNDSLIRKIFAMEDQITDLTREETDSIISILSSEKKASIKEEAISKRAARIVTNRSFIGFTTTGHTGEDVFFAAYAPDQDRPAGVINGNKINEYLCQRLGIKNLRDSTDRYFCPVSQLFRGFSKKVEGKDENVVITLSRGADTLVIPAFKNFVIFNGKTINLTTVTVYIEKNNECYVPRSLSQLIH